ncbi:MAG: Ig-like domain-containing protein [Promethearchaeota archaeon]
MNWTRFKKFILRNYVIISLVFLFIFSGISNTTTKVINSRIGNDNTQINSITNNRDKRNVLESISANSIELISPENTTYTSPMSGYYPATFGFENELHGTLGTNLEFLDEYDIVGSPQDYVGIGIIDGPYYGHNKMLSIGDAQGGTYTYGVHHFDNPPIAGTIEFYLLVDNIHSPYTGTHYFHLRAMDDTIAIEMRINVIGQYLSNIEYFDGSSWQLISDQVSYNWYHHSITFDCDAGTQGLFTWITKFENGTETGRVENIDFLNDLNTLDELYLASDVPTYFGSTLYDAFGFSWDPNYTVGDNLNEGLLLSYNPLTSLDWTGYSLDGGANVTIPGNTTIPMPSEGSHTIQVYGNDSVGTYYQSELRSFQVWPIEILTPENRIYHAPMSGYYPATYGFENEDGTFGTSIEFVDEYYAAGGYTGISVWDGPTNGHIKYLHVGDAQDSTTTWCVHHFDNSPTTGIIEFFVVAHGTVGEHHFALRASDDTIAVEMRVYVDGGKFQYFDGTSWQNIADLVVDTWFHHSIVFDCEAGGGQGQFDWIVSYENGTEVGSVNSISFQNDLDKLDELYIGSTILTYLISTQWDAFGFSWDPNYNVGDNLNEGLLLSYYTPTPLNWTGYSLDGGANITIPGNTTIPIPSDGDHMIQVFANDSEGNYYQSELRSFQVISIEVLSPKDKTYNTPMNGYYPASWGFENNVPGREPSDWNLEPSGGTSFYRVNAEYDGHKNVLEMRKIGGTTQVMVTKNFLSSATVGTVEFWLQKDTEEQSDPTRFFLLNSSGHPQIIFYVEEKDLYHRNYGEGSLLAWDVIAKDTWYHFRIDFDVSQSGWHLQVNGVWYGGTIPFYYSVANRVSGFQMASIDTGDYSDYGAFLDAVGYSWDPGYITGANLNEGLLLSYNTSTPLNWTGYSLDGGANVTIPGNTTIRVPSDGSHTIQVYGNDSLGNWYFSKPRSFQCFLNPPSITSPPDQLDIELGDIGRNILWSVSDPNPANYTVYRNGTVFEEGNLTTTPSPVFISLDGLSEGNHNFTCVARNIFAMPASDEVWITVGPDETPPDISSPSDISFEDGSIGYTILWTGSDIFPWWASVHRNDDLIYDQAWVGNDIRISLDGLPIGLSIFNCTLFDEAGNSVYDVVEVNVTEAVLDTIAPKVTAPGPLEFEEGTTGHILTWICSDDHPYAYKIQINNIDELFNPWRGGNVVYSADDLPVGVWEVNLTLYDLSGNLASSPVIVTVIPEAPDTTAPTVSHPEELIVAENTASTIVWEVDDKHPDWYTISRNGSVIYEQHYWVPGIIQFHFTSLPLGTWEFKLTVWDEAGNSASGIAIVIALPGDAFDINPPDISHVADIQYTYGTTNHYLIVYLFDEHPQGYSISITTDTNITEQIWTSPNIRVDFCLDDLAVGSYTVTITAWDAFGNTETSTVKVTVQGDITPPTISYQPDITAYENTNITLTWQISDEAPSHFELIFLPEGKVNQSGSWSGNTIEIIIRNLPTGTYRYRLIVYDVSGNYAVDDFTLTVIESRGAPGFEILTAVLFLLFFARFRAYFNLKRRKGK